MVVADGGAGSYIRDEFVFIRSDGEFSREPSQQLSRHVCHICGDDVGLSVGGELLVACNECTFPICRTCNVYERTEGSLVCPPCKTRFKHLTGCARVAGDGEEDDADDLENEFNFSDESQNLQSLAELNNHMNYGLPGDTNLKLTEPSEHTLASHFLMDDRLSRLDDITPEQHSVVAAKVAHGSSSIHPLHFTDSRLLVQPKSFDPSRELAAYGYGSTAWKERVENWNMRQEYLHTMKHGKGGSDIDYHGEGSDPPLMDESRLPLSRKLPISASQMNPYRMIIIMRLVVLGFFFHYRILHPVNNAYALWLVSIICEIWFAISWILDQFPKWFPVDRETYLDRLSLSYEKEAQPSELSSVDIFVSTVDPSKEPPLVTANTVLSILAVDYPADKVSCYVSDDGASILTFVALSETSEFARKWVPFCKKFNIEPRAPEWYFAEKMDYLRDKVFPDFVKERRAIKREYEEFKVRINAFVAKAQKVPDGVWNMQDGKPWPGDNVRDHPGMIQVLLGQSGGHGNDGKDLPCLVYVSREKRPGLDHHKKAGAMNALVRVSAVLTNAPYILNLDCDHYINNSKAIREAMCFMMDPLIGKKVCYVQFPQRFDGIDRHDQYANRNTVFFDINMKGLDGIQGPIYVGTGCVFRRLAFYGFDAPKSKKSPRRSCKCWPNWCCFKWCPSPRKKEKLTLTITEKRINFSGKDNVATPACNIESKEGCEVSTRERSTTMPEHILENKFGQSPIFIASTLLEDGGAVESVSSASLLKEAIHVIGCEYEHKTDWGKEVGWIYGSVTEDILTGFKMHCHGWRSVYCVPQRPAFKGSAPINLSDRLHQVQRWALGSVEIFLSRHCPLWYGYGGRLKCLERLSYINATIYPFTSIPLATYCALPAVCLLTEKFITPELNNVASLWLLSLFLCIFTTSLLEMRWSGVSLDDWWRNEQFWVIGGVSAHLFAVVQGFVKVVASIDTKFTVTSKAGEANNDELYVFRWTAMLLPPSTLLILNVIGIAAGISNTIAGISNTMANGYEAWGPLLGRLFFALWVILHLYPFLKGLVGHQKRTPTVIVVWSILLASMFSLFWVRVDPFLAKFGGPVLEDCGLDCN
ncbi:hypothetical protein ACS0TY_011748 [Phlomoides rotata]